MAQIEGGESVPDGDTRRTDPPTPRALGRPRAAHAGVSLGRGRRFGRTRRGVGGVRGLCHTRPAGADSGCAVRRGQPRARSAMAGQEGVSALDGGIRHRRRPGGLTAAFIWSIVPPLVGQGGKFVDDLPSYLRRLSARVEGRAFGHRSLPPDRAADLPGRRPSGPPRRRRDRTAAALPQRSCVHAHRACAVDLFHGRHCLVSSAA